MPLSSSDYEAQLATAAALTKMLSCRLPSLDHFQYSDYNDFYEPSDDTFLMCDGLSLDLPSHAPSRILELGTGSGCNLVHAASLSPPGTTCFAIDINPLACAATLKTWECNKTEGVDFVITKSDLLGAGSEPWWPEVDCVIFNPPYVPTPDEEVGGEGIEASWAGGEEGRVVIDKALPQIWKVLKTGGVLYMIVVDDNNPLDIINTHNEAYETKGEVLVRRQARNEFLSVLKMVKK
ncbi:hypothetical protein TL16_g08968 [Triparma laevis f. inornata]|uniref:Methyltransferase small domain-containing protein n=2 Tax=Triparma laevis TaxID=1534972 RepID=A0A9W7DXI7_9STRA|nr:hypothetical protein TrLO_g10941 [Triparma laevis f. longispina]GMH81562.1 hypothetical protein TL16_g08968 [Triparma laevis f. inornata]